MTADKYDDIAKTAGASAGLKQEQIPGLAHIMRELARSERAEQKEECARVAEEIGEKHLQWSKMNLPVEPSPIIAKDRADVAKRIAAAIRALE